VRAVMEVGSAGGCVGMEAQRSGALERVQGLEAGRSGGRGGLEVMQAWSRRGLPGGMEVGGSSS